MRLITYASFKGGAGKSTALMATAGALCAQGNRVALFEADENHPLRSWRVNAMEHESWDESCRIFDVADEIKRFNATFEEAEAEGFDYGLVDTHGGGSDLNDHIVCSSDLIVIPTALTSFDVDTTIETFEHVVALFEELEDVKEAPAAVLIQRMSAGRTTTAEAAHLAILDALPQYDVRMRNRSAFADLKTTGMLHLHLANLKQKPAKRLEARHIGVASKEADDLAAELVASIEEIA